MNDLTRFLGLFQTLHQVEVKTSTLELTQTHTPGWKWVLNQEYDACHIFESNNELYGIGFDADCTYDTTKGHDIAPRICFSLSQLDQDDMPIMSSDELYALAEHTDQLKAWLLDCCKVMEAVTSAAPNIPVHK